MWEAESRRVSCSDTYLKSIHCIPLFLQGSYVCLQYLLVWRPINILWPSFFLLIKVHFSSVQWLSCVRHFATPWIAARQASLSSTNSRSYSDSRPSFFSSWNAYYMKAGMISVVSWVLYVVLFFCFLSFWLLFGFDFHYAIFKITYSFFCVI